MKQKPICLDCRSSYLLACGKHLSDPNLENIGPTNPIREGEAPQSKPMEAQAPAPSLEPKAICEPGKHSFPVTGPLWGNCRTCGVNPYSAEALGEPSIAKAPATAKEIVHRRLAAMYGSATSIGAQSVVSALQDAGFMGAGVDPEDVALMDEHIRMYHETDSSGAWSRIKSRRSPLVWTKEKPTKIGWYFTKAPRLSANMCQLSMDGDGSLYVAHFGIRGTTDLARIFADQLWAGPIPEPVSPDNSQEGKPEHE